MIGSIIGEFMNFLGGRINDRRPQGVQSKYKEVGAIIAYVNIGMKIIFLTEVFTNFNEEINYGS